MDDTREHKSYAEIKREAQDRVDWRVLNVSSRTYRFRFRTLIIMMK